MTELDLKNEWSPTININFSLQAQQNLHANTDESDCQVESVKYSPHTLTSKAKSKFI